MEQYRLSASLRPGVPAIKRLIAWYMTTTDIPGFVDACERLFDLPHVERTATKVDVVVDGREAYRAYRDACLIAAQHARPVGAAGPSAETGGGGQDGSIRGPRRAY